MNGTDFIFDGEKLSDHNMMICSFSSSEQTWTGGEITFTTIKPPNSDKQDFYLSSYDTPLSCEFSICKITCGIESQEDMKITMEDYGNLMRWLVRKDGYHWMQFDVPEFEDVYFNAYFNLKPYVVGGVTVGFDVTMTTDSPYGYSKLYKKSFDITTDKYTFINYSDAIGTIYPKCTIKPKKSGLLNFKSGISGDEVETEITSVIANDSIILDGKNDLFVGNFDASGFNFNFPIMKNSYTDRNTYFYKTSNSVDFTMDLEWRYIRMVTV